MLRASWRSMNPSSATHQSRSRWRHRARRRWRRALPGATNGSSSSAIATSIGYAYAAPFHGRAAYQWSVEISIYLAKDARGSGLGRELLSELLDSLSQRGFVNAFAGIALPNPVSVRLFEAFGFEKVAQQRNVGFKLGAWHDVGWWQRQLRAPTSPPPDISPRAPVVLG